MESDPPLDKRKLIREHVSGLSYVDVGGLWGTTGETMTTAALAGASRVAMADIQDLGSVWWQRFETHCAERAVEHYDKIQVDICAPDAPARLGTFDVVHCSGVMYHVADLFRFVGNLVSVAERYLLLSSVVMPPVIHGRRGQLTFGPDQAFLSPILSPQHQEIVRDYLAERGMSAGGITQPSEFFDRGEPRFGPWWWLFSGGFMSRVVQLYGLEVLAEGATPNGNGWTVFARIPRS